MMDKFWMIASIATERREGYVPEVEPQVYDTFSSACKAARQLHDGRQMTVFVLEAVRMEDRTAGVALPHITEDDLVEMIRP
jgi:hypothetical protein